MGPRKNSRNLKSREVPGHLIARCCVSPAERLHGLDRSKSRSTGRVLLIVGRFAGDRTADEDLGQVWPWGVQSILVAVMAQAQAYRYRHYRSISSLEAIANPGGGCHVRTHEVTFVSGRD